MTPKIRRSRRHCSVYQQINMVFSDEDKILIKTHKYTQHTVIRLEELKSVHLKCLKKRLWPQWPTRYMAVTAILRLCLFKTLLHVQLIVVA